MTGKAALIGGGVGLVLLLALAYGVKRMAGGNGAAGIGASIGAGAVDLGAGLVLGIGDAVGVPRTDDDACTIALREGRLWDASFVCPASRFIKEGVLGGAAQN